MARPCHTVNTLGSGSVRCTPGYRAANSGDLLGLAALLGHSNLNRVMIYTEPRLEDLARRMERVG